MVKYRNMHGMVKAIPTSLDQFSHITGIDMAPNPGKLKGVRSSFWGLSLDPTAQRPFTQQPISQQPKQPNYLAVGQK